MIADILRNYRTFKKYAMWDRAPFFELAKKYAEGKRVIVDIGPGNDRFAKLLGRPDAHLLEGNAESAHALISAFPNTKEYRAPDPLPFADESVDFIHLSHIVEHLEPAALYALLQEINRVLAREGVLVISAPLSNERFYDDLSHVRPYPPGVFFKYLTRGEANCVTRPIISNAFIEKELMYRYTPVTAPQVYHNFLWRMGALLVKKLGGARYERSGFTLVLQKIV